MNEQVLELLRRVQSTADFGYVTFESINSTNAFGDNALHCVCVWGDLVAAKLLVENGINVNQPGEHGFTPLRIAVEFGDTELAEYLLANGADAAAIEAEETFDPKANALHMQGLGEQITVLQERVAKCERDTEHPSFPPAGTQPK